MSADADTKTGAVPSEPARPAARARFPSPQLRIHDRQVFVGFGATPLAEGLVLADLALIVPDVAFPFDIAGGAATRYQKRPCRFGYLDLQLDHALVHRAVRRTLAACAEHVAALALHLRAGRLEGEGLLHAPQGPAPFTFRVGFQPEGTSVLAAVFDVRLYGPSPLPAPFLAAVLARGAHRAQAVPEGAPWGAVGLTVDPVPGLLRQAVPLRGFRLPEMREARLSRVEPGPAAFHLHFAANARPDTSLDEGLLGTVEGSRSFAEGEALLARGELAAAEAYYLRHGEAPDAHPFAQERLLGLLAARPDARDLALDLATAILRARPGSSFARWAEASLRLARGEPRAAGEAFLQLAASARERGEEAAAFHAFAAAGRALSEEAPARASRALQDALVSRPDDLDCLLALAGAADRARDAEGAMRAYRRIAALARDPAQAARAHVRLARLRTALARDSAGARLHLDAALRLCPDDPEALEDLARLCQADGEPLRALRALDQLRRAALDRADPALEARACLAAGAVWEEALGHEGNALLRYQEAAARAPADPEPALRLGALYERTGRAAEALEAWQQALVLAEARLHHPADGEASRAFAHRARHALARLAERLGEKAAALAHLEAAAALVPDDALALRALLPVWREAGRRADLARGCERCAAVAKDPRERAALLAEAGALLAGPLAQPERGERLLEQALLLDADREAALAAMADLCEARGDGPGLCRHLLRLCELAPAPAHKLARLLRLSGAARDLAQDLDLAADALGRALALAPDDLASRAELCRLQRRRGDLPGLDAALAGLASLLEADGQYEAAGRALVERADLLEGPLARPEEALALLERALVLAPEDAAVLRSLARTALRLSRPAAAREALRSLLAALPEGEGPAARAELNAQLGLACEALGDRPGALEATASAFADRPGDDALGERLEGLLGEAEGRAPDVARVRLARARAARDAGRGGLAAAHFLRAARLLERLADERGAALAFRGALDADPDGPTAPEALDALIREALGTADAPRASALLARRAAFEPEPRDAARQLFRAASLARDGSPARSRELLGLALARDESFPPARAAMARLLLASGEVAAALAHAQAALEGRADPDALPSAELVGLELLAADAALGAGELEAARAHLSRYCAARPEDAAALAQLVGLERRRGDRPALLALLPRLAARAAPAQALPAWRELAALLAEDPSRRAEGAAAWRQALSLDPDDVAALTGLSSLLTAPEEAPERVRLLGRLVDLVHEPARVGALLSEAGEALLGAGRPREAADAFEKAARASPDPALALERLAAAARAGGEADREAAALLRRAALSAQRREEGAAERHVAAALRLAELARAGDAEALLARALQLEPSEPVQKDALQALADLCEGRREWARAAEHLSRLASLLKGSERCAALLRRAELQRAAGEPRLARESLEDALKASPGDRRAILALRDLCAALGDEAGDAAALEALLALPQPDRRAAAPLWEELGERRERLGQPEAAERAYRRALAFDRARPAAAEALYALLAKRGELAEAVALGEGLAAREAAPKAAARRFAELARIAWHGLGDRPLALRFAREADARAPEDAPNALLLAESLYLMGATSGALAIHRRLAAGAALDDVPDRAREVRLQLAELLAAAGETAAAAAALRGLLEEDPRLASAAERLFELLLGADPQAALEALERHAAALAPSRRAGALFLRLAAERRRRGESAQAARLLELARPSADDLFALERLRADALRAAGLPRELADALRAVVDQALARDERAAALAALDELAALQAGLGEPGREASALGEAADLCADLGDAAGAAARLLRRGLLQRDLLADPDGAERAFRRAFQLAPGRGEAARLAAELCARRGDPGAQEALLAAAAPLWEGPADRALAFLGLARLRVELANPRGAEGAVAEALALQPALEPARALLEELFERQGRRAELARALEAHAGFAQAVGPRLAMLLRAARLFRDEVGDPEAAARALGAARDLSPGDLSLAEECAAALDAAGRAGEARALDAWILSAEVLRDDAFARQRARLAASGEHGALALLLEARAAREAPEPAVGRWLDAGDARAREGDLAAALADARRALELDPREPRAFAAVLERLGKGAPAARAEALLARARAVPAEALALHRERARLLAGLPDGAAAAQALDAVLELAPDDAEALAARAARAVELSGPDAARPFDERLFERSEQGAPVPAGPLAEARARLGLWAGRQGETAAAIAHLEAAIARPLRADLVDAALAALDALLEPLGDRAALYRVRMARAERASPLDQAAALERSLAAAPDPSCAREVLERLCALSPGDAALQERRAEAVEAAGDLGAAALAWGACADAALSPGERARALLRAAAAWQRSGEPERARAERLRAREVAPADRGAARACLADLRASGGAALLSALQLLEGSEREPEAAAARLERAQVLDGAGEKARAAQAFLDIARRGPAAEGFAQACARARELFEELEAFGPAAEALGAWAAAQAGEAASRALLEAARLLERGGDAGAALALLERAAEAAPESAAPWEARAALRGRLGEAVPRARALVEQARRTGDAEGAAALLAEAAEIFGARGLPEALDALRAAVGARPADAELRVKLADAWEAHGDPASAFDQLEAARGQLAPAEPRWQTLTRRAAALARGRGRPQDATRLLAELFARDPLDAEAFEAARATLAAARPADWLRALEAREAALSDAGAEAAERAAVLAERGRQLAALDRPDEAREALRGALRTDPGCGAAAEALRALAERAGDAPLLAEALQAQAGATSDRQARLGLLLQLGEVCAARLGEDARAAEAYQAALACAQGPAEVAPCERALAIALVDAALPARALQVLSRRLQDPRDASDPALLELAAEACLQQEDRAGARAYLLQALERAPGRDSAFALLGELADEAPGDLGAALLLRAGGAPAGPARAALLREAASAFARASQPERARAALQASLREEPDSRDGFEALCAALAGSPLELREALIRRLDHAGGAEERRALLLRLAQLEPESDPSAALGWLERALALDPGSAEVLGLLADALGHAAPAALLPALDRLSAGPARSGVAALCLTLARGREGRSALPVLDRAVQLAPDSPAAFEAWRAAAREAGDGGRELAAVEGLLRLSPGPAERARLHREAWELSSASPSRDPSALEHLRQAASLAPDAALLQRLGRELRAAGDAKGAVEALLASAALEGGSAPRRETLLEAADLQVDALRAPLAALATLERTLDGGEGDRGVLERICALAQRGRDPAALIAAAERLERLAGPEAVAPLHLPLGRALAAAGRPAEGLARLRLALAAAPDPSLAAEARALAERAGDLAAWAEIELSLVAGVEGKEPGAAAPRLRALARRLEGEDPERAATLWGRAHALAPEDGDLERQAALWAASPARALAPLARLARLQPASAERRRPLEAAARAAGDLERAELLASADGFFDLAAPRRPASLEGILVTPGLREMLVDPPGAGAVARLLRRAAPALGLAFADDPGRVGLRPEQRLGPLHGAALFSRASAAQRATGLAAIEAWLDPRGGVEVRLLPGSPDRLVIGLGAAAGLDGAALAFLLLRACELAGAGGALALQAGPDLPELVRCALAACGEPVEVAPAFAGRVAAVRAALPPGEDLRPLCARARDELAALEPAALVDALIRAAGRVAMIALGDAGAALRATARALGAEPAAMDPTSLAGSSPALQDLLAALLRDDLGALRRSCRGGPP